MVLSFRTAVVGASLALLLAGAAYLYVVRGPAILMDIAAMGRGLLCL
jgi:hypothetical protein